MVECDGEADDNNATDGVDHCQIWTACASPHQMNNGDSWTSLDKGACGGFTQIPGAIIRRTSQITKLNILAIWCDVGNGARP